MIRNNGIVADSDDSDSHQNIFIQEPSMSSSQQFLQASHEKYSRGIKQFHVPIESFVEQSAEQPPIIQQLTQQPLSKTMPFSIHRAQDSLPLFQHNYQSSQLSIIERFKPSFNRAPVATEHQESGSGNCQLIHSQKYKRNLKSPKFTEGICTSLKAISKIVINIIRARKQTTHKYISKKLIQLEELSSNCAVTRAQEECIKRRIYDVLNALEPMGIIKKEGKIISPANMGKIIVKEELQRQCKQALVSLLNKCTTFAMLGVRFKAMKKLFDRNRQHPQQRHWHRLELLNIVTVPKEILKRKSQANNSPQNKTKHPLADLIYKSDELQMLAKHNSDFAVLMDTHDLFDDESATI